MFDVTGIDAVLMLQQKDVLDYDGDSNTTETTRSFYHRNALGSVVDVSDAREVDAVRYRFSAYGEITITRNGGTQGIDPLGQHVSFASRWSDEETALQYVRCRRYSPLLGRFTQRDPLAYSFGANL